MITRWRGRGEPQEQVANACDSFVNLTPVSETAAETTAARWSALLPGGDIPLIWEDSRNGGEQEDDEFC